MSGFDRRIAAIAATQRMLVTLDDVHRAGGTQRHAQIRCDAGRWRRVEHGVYLINGAPFDWTTRLLASVLAAGQGAVASDGAAARLYRFNGFATAPRELTIPRGRRYRRRDLRTHERRDLHKCTTRWVDGVPVTDPGRTLLDVAAAVGDRRLARLMEQARRLDLVTWSSLIDTLQVHARRGRTGVRRFRRVIAANAHRDEITDSDFEFLVLSLLLEHGLPRPELHHRVHQNGRFIAEVDLAYPELFVAIECDGDLHRVDRTIYERDKPRRTDLSILGWTIVEVSWDRFRHDPDRVVRDVRDARRAAQRRVQRSAGD